MSISMTLAVPFNWSFLQIRLVCCPLNYTYEGQIITGLDLSLTFHTHVAVACPCGAVTRKQRW